MTDVGAEEAAALDALEAACAALVVARRDVAAALAARDAALRGLRDAGVPVRRLGEYATGYLLGRGWEASVVDGLGLSSARRALDRRPAE